MSPSPHLELDRLNCSFDRTPVLKDLSLSVARGESLVIFGPSGCGKTTLLRLISGTMAAESGRVLIDGQDATHVEPEFRGIAMAFQSFALYPHMSAYENIASPLKAQGLDKATIDRRIRDSAAMLKIEHVLSHKPGALSNGQKQRTALARSLVPQPSIVLLDDPLRNVDAKLRYEMRLELPRIVANLNATMIYVTQDFKEAMALGDRVAVLLDGAIRQVDNPSRLYQQPRDREVAQLFGDPPINLIDVRPQRDGHGRVTVTIGDHTLDASGCPEALVDTDCTIGLRPEDVDVLAFDADDALPVHLEAVLPLNVRTAVRLSHASGLPLVASAWDLDPEFAARQDTDVWARVHLDRAIYFPSASH
jgi:multiple sugar transport system ATP-binding protein